MELSKLASAIYNDIQSGVAGMNANPTISLEQLEDEVIEMRQTILKEYWLKNLLKKEDMLMAINCVPVDCADQNRCCSTDNVTAKMARHFEIPQLMDDLGGDAIAYIGSTDRSVPFRVYFDKSAANWNKYRNRGGNKPYVYIERTPNTNNMYDGWIYNAPLIENLSVIGVFKDPRQLEDFTCCNQAEFKEMGSISTEIKNRIVSNKLKLYRQYAMPAHPTDLKPR